MSSAMLAVGPATSCLALEWFVIHHTDCGMETFTDEVMRSLLRQSLDTASSKRTAGTMPGAARVPRKVTSLTC